MRPSFARVTVTRLRYPARTDHRTPVVDYDATPAESPIEGCWLEPLTSTEDNNQRTAVLSGYTVDAPAGIDLRSTDRVRYAGILFEVDGRPLPVLSPTRALDSTTFVLKVWEG